MRLILRNLTKNIEKMPVFNRISYSFESGLIYGLTGAKHSGKTLLFRSIAGEEAFDKGHIRINRNDKDCRIGFGDVGCVLSNSPLLDFLTGEEFLKHFLELHNLDYDAKKISEYLTIIGVDESLSKKQIYHYSEELKCHLQLLCVYILKPDVILVEEDMEDVSDNTIKLVKKLLDELKKDCIVIMSTTNGRLLSEVCDEVVELKEGILSSMDMNILSLED